jgi:hypothetical protein
MLWGGVLLGGLIGVYLWVTDDTLPDYADEDDLDD